MYSGKRFMGASVAGGGKGVCHLVTFTRLVDYAEVKVLETERPMGYPTSRFRAGHQPPKTVVVREDDDMEAFDVRPK